MKVRIIAFGPTEEDCCVEPDLRALPPFTVSEFESVGCEVCGKEKGHDKGCEAALADTEHYAGLGE